jgi:hypothetical protein
MSMPEDFAVKVTIRDLFWLVLMAALALGWWLDRTRQAAKHEQFRAKIRSVLETHGLTEGCRIGSGCIGCDLGGVVVETSATGLVEVSLGSDDGLKAGHTLQVYRGKRYLGQITIRSTVPDRAIGQIDKQLQRGPIQMGDNVTTKLN